MNCFQNKKNVRVFCFGQAVRKHQANTFPFRPHTRLINNRYIRSDFVYVYFCFIFFMYQLIDLFIFRTFASKKRPPDKYAHKPDKTQDDFIQIRQVVRNKILFKENGTKACSWTTKQC